MSLQQLQIRSKETSACNTQPLGLGVFNQPATSQPHKNIGEPEMKVWSSESAAWETP